MFSYLGTSQFESGDRNENDYAINKTATYIIYKIIKIIIIKLMNNK